MISIKVDYLQHRPDRITVKAFQTTHAKYRPTSQSAVLAKCRTVNRMSAMNYTTVVTVNGTDRSEAGLGLDDGERSTFTINPGEYDRGIQSLEDLIGRVGQSAYLRGEWISSLSIDGADVVTETIAGLLRERHGNVDEVVQGMAEEPMFCNADGDDLRLLVHLLQVAVGAGRSSS